MFMLRHVLCVAVLQMHRATRQRGEHALPASQPPLAHEVLRADSLLLAVVQLAEAAGVSDQFHSVSD